MVAHPLCFDTVTSAEANDGAAVREVLVLGGDAPAGATALDTLKGRAAGDGVAATVAGVGGDDLVILPFSSGTTGLPKGTMITHDNLVTNLRQFVAPEFAFVGADDAIISPLPMFHIYGFAASLMMAAWRGNHYVTMQAFDLVRFCELVAEHRPTRAHLVPPIILGLAKHPVIDDHDFSSLKMIISAAAPLGPDVEAACRPSNFRSAQN